MCSENQGTVEGCLVLQFDNWTSENRELSEHGMMETVILTFFDIFVVVSF